MDNEEFDFDNDPGIAVGRILSDVSYNATRSENVWENLQQIRDYNGNVIGSWRVE